ncbi:hypothetical protein GC089_01280 [Cellulomonas sp. JZ18]|uniref:hypothetical protein n=1 Tax=Cellulomonas sp. JZ18 TaxID=2654191 RepID=UPI0012D49E16|nr:hypothetical protein [Cellulomonas sp. JZ18]QGQ18150.1 hypothetical protein GC089_01280 [Cellulomonas sp. JZ18]
MDPTAGGALRTARALLVAATALSTAAAAHLAAGGTAPRSDVAAALLALTTAALLPVSGPRTFRVSVLAPVGAVLQVVLHHAFTAAAAGTGAGTPAVGRAGHHPGTPVAVPGAAAGRQVVPVDAEPVLHDLPMLLAHVAAAVATAVVLVATDRAARAAAAWLTRVLPLLVRTTAPVAAKPRPLPVTARPRPASPGAALGSSARRRGPPARLRVAP